MPTLNQALTAIERHLGFPISRGRTVATRLQEAGYIEHGAPGVAPQVSHDGFVALLIGLASGKTLSEVGAAVATCLEATPGGVSLAGAPVSVARLRAELLVSTSSAIILFAINLVIANLVTTTCHGLYYLMDRLYATKVVTLGRDGKPVTATGVRG